MKRKNSEKRKNTINRKYYIPTIIAITILCIIIVIAIFFLAYIQNLINQSILTNLGEITKQDKEKIENRIQEHTRILETIVNEIEEKNLKNEQEIFNIYYRNSGNNEFSRIAILYEDGTTVTSDGKTVDLSDEKETFFSITEMQLSRSRKSKVNNEEINIYSKKIHLQNRDIVILLAIDNDKYRELFTKNIFNGNAIESLITNNGDIVANSKNEESGGNIFEDLKDVNEKEKRKIDKMKTEISENQEGQTSYKIQGKNYYISYQKLVIGKWTLIVIVPEDIIAKDLIRLLEIVIISAIMIVIVMFFITIYIVISNVKKKEKLYELAYIDPITKLGNYNAYLEKIKQKLEINDKKTIIILDIDKFKTFNKKYGHNKGNELLRRIGEEIEKSIRKTDIVCRLGNDVFGICLEGEVDLKEITERLNEKLSRIQIGNTWYTMRISIGIYVCGKDEKDVQSIIDKAIIAHDSVKGNYNKKYGNFSERMEQQLSKESEIENRMEEAIKNKEFEIYYQPQISTKTEKVEGAEALIRWKKDGEIIPPNEFIPVFERNLFIIKLDEYIYQTVCEQVRKMKKELKNIPKISINISRESLLEKDFIKKYMQIANEYEIEPNEIELEITERTTVDDNTNMKEILEKIKEKGFRIAIDDFGTGYSSLNMLETLPIDTIKIDKSFVDKIGKENNKINLLEIILVITKKLKLKTVAEGVEKIEQVNYLKARNCDLIQGYFYSKPLEYESFKKYIKENENGNRNY